TEERFRVTVLPRSSRLDVQQLQACLMAVPPDRRGDELRAVITANVPRHAAGQEQAGENVQHAIRGDAAVDLQGQALSRVLVGDGKPLQRPAALRAVVDEVPAPDMIFVFGSTTRATVAAVAQSPLFP